MILRFVLITVITFIAILTAIILACIYWAFEDIPGVYLKREILTPEVHIGETLVTHSEVLWNKDCRSTVNRIVVDGLGGIRRFDSEDRLNRKGFAIIDVRLRIPRDAEPGNARYRVIQEFYCNPWQRVVSPLYYEQSDLPFKILPQREGTVVPPWWEEGYNQKG